MILVSIKIVVVIVNAPLALLAMTNIVLQRYQLLMCKFYIDI